MKYKSLSTILQRVQEISTLPDILAAIVSTVEDPNSSAADLNRLISQDPSLSARVLKLANSAYYGLQGRIHSLTQAIVILGFNTVRSLAISISVLDTFKLGEYTSIDLYRRLWIHSLATAICARRLAQSSAPSQREECFTGGLLHDIGFAIMAQFFREEFSQLLNAMETERITLTQAEAKLELGVDHGNVGAVVGSIWRLPESLVEIIGKHHHPPAPVGPAARIGIVHAADILMRVSDLGPLPEPMGPGLDEINPDVRKFLRLEEGLPLGMIMDVKEEVGRNKDVIEGSVQR